jgi:hypothetical protein
VGREFAAVLWDVDLERFDLDKHAPFLVRRVLERGCWEHWRRLVALLGLKRIEEIAVSLKRLDPRAHSFCAVVFRRPLESFACSNAKPSFQGPWRS